MRTRIKAGVDLDGNDVGAGPRNNTGNLAPVLNYGLNRPFMIMAPPGSDINTVPAWKPFRKHSTGWHLDLTLKGRERRPLLLGCGAAPADRAGSCCNTWRISR